MNHWARAIGLLVVGIPAAAMAQTATGDTSSSSSSWLPFTTDGYVGVGAGQSHYAKDCAPLLECNGDDVAYKAYVGGRLWNILGLEAAYVNMGQVERNAGTASAQGVDLNLVANIPLSRYFGVFGEGGPSYLWTRTHSALPLYPTGRDDDFNWDWGGGVDANVTSHFTVRAEWQQHHASFTDGGEKLDMWTGGVNYRF